MELPLMQFIYDCVFLWLSGSSAPQNHRIFRQKMMNGKLLIGTQRKQILFQQRPVYSLFGQKLHSVGPVVYTTHAFPTLRHCLVLFSIKRVTTFVTFQSAAGVDNIQFLPRAVGIVLTLFCSATKHKRFWEAGVVSKIAALFNNADEFGLRVISP